MRRASFLCIIFILLISCPCFSYDGELYRNDQYFFSIKIPKGWTIEKGRNPHVVIKAMNDTRNATVGVTVQALSPGEMGRQITDLVTGESIAEGYRENGAKAVLLDSGLTQIWNEQAVWVNILLSISHLGKTVHTIQYQVVTFHLGYMYSLSVGAGSDNQPEVLVMFERFEPEFQQVLASFAFEDWQRPDSKQASTPDTTRQPPHSTSSGISQQPSNSAQQGTAYSQPRRQPMWPGPIENFMPPRRFVEDRPATPSEPPTDVDGKPIISDNPFEPGYQEILKRERASDCLLKYQKRAKCDRAAHIINLACNCMFFLGSCNGMDRSVCQCVFDNISDAQTDVAANLVLKACKGKKK